jgi:hypothetical protein
MVHGNGVEVSKASLLKGFGVIEHLPSMPYRFSRFCVSGPGTNLREYAPRFVLAFTPSEQLDVVQGYV